jgi:hypothetical protein
VDLTFDATVWEYEGPAAWYFVTVPVDDADVIADATAGRTGGFGSVRVEVTVGTTTWRTSLFPDTKAGSYLLPLKRHVRDAEGLDVGSPVQVRLRVLDPSTG